MPILTINCQSYVTDKATTQLRPCNRFLSRIRYERIETSMKAYNQELICSRCKARSVIIWDDENKQFHVICLSKDKTPGQAGYTQVTKS